MRYIRFLHFLYLGLLIIFDLILSSIYHQFPLFLDVSSNLAIVGLIILSKTENTLNTVLKSLVLCFVLDLFHIQSFPIFLISIIPALLFTQGWNRHIGSSTVEITAQVAIALFIKEMLVWLVLPIVKGMSFPVESYIATHVLWTVVLNSLWVPMAIGLNGRIHRFILQRNQNYRLK